jgi:ATP-dependent Clp endopeptidase proteolytic subunit ClpP
MKFLATLLATLMLALPAMAGSKAKVRPRPVKKFDRIQIDEDRLLVLKGDVRAHRVDPIVEEMVLLSKDSPRKIFMVINTNGGSIEAGMRLVTTMRSIDNEVICLVDSKAYSMGAIIAAFCTRTYVQKHAMLMFHEAHYGVSGMESIVPSRVEATQKYLKLFHTEIAKRLKMSYTAYRDKIITEWWMTAEEAVRAGVAHAVIDKLVYEYEEPKSRNPFFILGDDLNNPLHIEMGK